MSKKNAAEVLRMAKLSRPWLPNTPELTEYFGLSQSGGEQLVREVKALAADQGLMWGWDPKLESYRIAPFNAPKIAQRMVDYAYGQWAHQGRNTSNLVRGAKGSAYISAEDYKVANRRNKSLTRGIVTAATKVNIR